MADEPDWGVEPSQWFGQAEPLRGEQKLCLAILEQALDDWRVATTTEPLKFPTRGVRQTWERQLRFWFTAPIRDLGSFDWLCDTLGMNKKRLRSRILAQGNRAAVKGRSLRRAS